MSQDPSKKKKKKVERDPQVDTGPKFEEEQEHHDNEQPLLAKNIYDSHGKGKTEYSNLIDGEEIELGEQKKKKKSPDTKKNKEKQKEEKKEELFEEKKGDEPPRATSFVPRATMKSGAQDDIWTYRANDVNTHDRRMTANSIRTSKYTALTFLPKNLFEQFSKMANVYFLFIMVLQIIPQISITGGQPAILLPLLFVCAVSAVKDLFEDIKRHRADD